jgi:hypothetical protein
MDMNLTNNQTKIIEFIQKLENVSFENLVREFETIFPELELEKYNNIIKIKMENKFDNILLESQTMSPICVMNLEKKIDNLHNINWQFIKIYNYYISSLSFVLLNHQNIWYIIFFDFFDKTQLIIQELYGTSKIIKIAKILKLLSNMIKNPENLNTNFVYHLNLVSNKFSINGLCNLDNSDRLYLEYIQEKYNLNLIKENTSGFNFDNQVYFSCYDELLTAIEQIDYNDNIYKQLSSGGYILFYENTKYYLTSEIYNTLLNIFYNNKNPQWIYLELYQIDNLSNLLPFVNNYSVDIIKRINTSLKTLSREILNIYHMTRKKQNSDLYKNLPKCYKTILYNIHKIYVSQKENKDNNQININDEKKSININIIYQYIKSLHAHYLRELYINRQILIDNLHKINYNIANIMYIQCIDTLTQIELIK